MSTATTPALDRPGLRRAAVALLSLGKEAAAKVLAEMEPEEVTELMGAVMALGAVGQDEVRASLAELADKMGQLSALTPATPGWVSETLTTALGPEAAASMLEDLTRPAPFAWLPGAEPAVLARVLEEESATAAAVTLSHAAPEQAADLLKRLSKGKQVEVARALGGLRGLAEDTVRQIDTAVYEQVGRTTTQARLTLDGTARLTEVLTLASRATREAVLGHLAETDPALAGRIREALFTFTDVLDLPRQALQTVLSQVAPSTLAVALFDAPPEVSATVFEHITERAAVVVREEVDLAQAVRASDVKAARAEIVATALTLEADGKIVIDLGDDEGEEDR